MCNPFIILVLCVFILSVLIACLFRPSLFVKSGDHPKRDDIAIAAITWICDVQAQLPKWKTPHRRLEEPPWKSAIQQPLIGAWRNGLTEKITFLQLRCMNTYHQAAYQEPQRKTKKRYIRD